MLEGVYEYPDVPKDVYRRHDSCRCTVEYEPGKGGKRQNVWTRRWKTEEERAVLKKEKKLAWKGLRIIFHSIQPGLHSIRRKV